MVVVCYGASRASKNLKNFPIIKNTQFSDLAINKFVKLLESWTSGQMSARRGVNSDIA